MDLNETLIFARIVQAGSFTGAAKELGMPKSTVSRKLSELEERLGARLLQRTTRKLSLTELGQIYYRDCERIVAQLEEAEVSITELQAEPRGLLRITAPLNFGFLGGIVADFLDHNAPLQVELVCTDRMVDLVEEGFDIGIRVGRLSDSSLIARSLGSGYGIAVASPPYLKLHGKPRNPADLKGHECIWFGGGGDCSFSFRTRARTRCPFSSNASLTARP